MAPNAPLHVVAEAMAGRGVTGSSLPHRLATAGQRQLRRRVIRAMRQQPWADTHFTFLEDRDGVVSLGGLVRNAHVKRGPRAPAEEAEGVREVVFHARPTPSCWTGAP